MEVDLIDSQWSTMVTTVAIGLGVVFLLTLLKRYRVGGVCTSKARMDGKTVIVTGANTGIGKEAALDFAARGARVILACRNEDKAVAAAREIISKTKSHQVLVRKLDLSSFESVRQFAEEFNKTEGRLDILVNNAGVYSYNHELTIDGLESMIQVNYLSSFLLTLLLMKKLKTSSPSRIINVSSVCHHYATPEMKSDQYSWAKCSKKDFGSFKLYGWSKFQLVLFTMELSKRLKGSGVTVNALCPGAVLTEVFRNFPLVNNTIFKIILAIPVWIWMKNPRQGAQTTIHCAVEESLEKVSGLYFTDCKVEPYNKLADDEELVRQVWMLSEELTGVQWSSEV